jgi:hypothetical protein
MSSMSVAYHSIIIIIITIIKAGPELRTTTPRPDSVGPPAGWPTGWLATRPLGPKPNHQNARSGNEHPPGNSSAIQPRIDCNRISQAGRQQQRCVDRRALSAQLTDMSIHACTPCLFLLLPCLLPYLFDSVRPAQRVCLFAMLFSSSFPCDTQTLLCSLGVPIRTPRKSFPAPFSVLFLAFGGLGGRGRGRGCGQRGAISRRPKKESQPSKSTRTTVSCVSTYVPSLAKTKVYYYGPTYSTSYQSFSSCPRPFAESLHRSDLTGCADALRHVAESSYSGEGVGVGWAARCSGTGGERRERPGVSSLSVMFANALGCLA